MPAPKGNQNARRKPWADALKRALARSKGSVDNGLNYLADQVLTDAINGDKQAQQEIFNRVDGKYHQSVELSGDEENPIAVTEVVRRIVKAESEDSGDI